MSGLAIEVFQTTELQKTHHSNKGWSLKHGAKEARIYNGEKTAYSISSAGKLDSHMEKNEIITLPNTICKNKLKMD